MTEYLETTVDKFTFQVAIGRLYSAEGVWALPLDGVIRLGISDYVQQRNGDVAFAECKNAGTYLNVGNEVFAIETIKVMIEFGSPISGEIVQVNPALDETPELINQDPYGAGWLVDIDGQAWQVESTGLMDAQAYFKHMKHTAEEEAKKL